MHKTEKTPYAIVIDGEIVGQWNLKGVLELYPKFEDFCKRVARSKAQWADDYTMSVRKIDPDYVMFRNTGRKRRVVVVNVANAPDGWLEHLTQLYGW